MAVRAGYVDSEVTSQSEDERGLNYVVRGPLNYNEFQVANLLMLLLDVVIFVKRFKLIFREGGDISCCLLH